MRTSSFVRQQLSLWVFNGLRARLTLAQEASSAQWHGGQKHKSDQAGRIAFVAPSMVCAALNDAVTLLHQDLLVIQDCVNLTSHNHSIVNGVGLVHPRVFFCKVPARIDTHAVKVGLCIHGCQADRVRWILNQAKKTAIRFWLNFLSLSRVVFMSCVERWTGGGFPKFCQDQSAGFGQNFRRCAMVFEENS